MRNVGRKRSGRGIRQSEQASPPHDRGRTRQRGGKPWLAGSRRVIVLAALDARQGVKQIGMDFAKIRTVTVRSAKRATLLVNELLQARHDRDVVDVSQGLDRGPSLPGIRVR